MTDLELQEHYNFLFETPSTGSLLVKNLRTGVRLGLSYEFTNKMRYAGLYQKETPAVDRLLIFLTKIVPLFVV